MSGSSAASRSHSADRPAAGIVFLSFPQGDSGFGDEIVAARPTVRFGGIRTSGSSGGNDLIRKSACDRASSLQELRGRNDGTSEFEQPLVDIVRFIEVWTVRVAHARQECGRSAAVLVH